MMNKRIFLWLFIFFLNSITGECYDFFRAGAQPSALSGYYATLSEIWSLNGNQAGITDITSPVVSFFYRQRFMLKDLSDKAIAFVYPTRILHSGIAYQEFGNSSYRETKFSIGTARKFMQKVSAGLRFCTYQTHMISQSHKSKIYNFNLDAGFIINTLENFSLGCYIQSLIPYRKNKNSVTKIPTIVGWGAAYNIDNKINLMTEFQLYNIPFYEWIGAIKILTGKNISIQSGFAISQNNTHSFSFGFALEMKKYELSLAFSQHNALGITPSFQINYNFKGK